MNLVHPVPTKKNEEALNSLVNRQLKNTKTWESLLTKAGQEAKSEEDLAQLKSDAWKELIESKTLGYFALLRNLRNILQQSPEMVDRVCEMLVDTNMISKSKVLPFRFTTAYEEIQKMEKSSLTRKVVMALDQALNISSMNVPKFDGETLVVIDTSGSMSGKPSKT